MHKPNLEEIEKEIEKKRKKRKKKDKPKMKVSGAGVKRLQRMKSTNYPLRGLRK